MRRSRMDLGGRDRPRATAAAGKTPSCRSEPFGSRRATSNEGGEAGAGKPYLEWCVCVCVWGGVSG